MKFIFLLFFTLQLSACAYLTRDLLKDPEVNLVDFAVTGLSLEDVSVEFKMNVKNPNPLPLNLDELVYSINFSGQNVTSGVFTQGVSIPALGENTLVVPLKFKYSSVGNLVTSLLKNTFKKEYEISGTAKLGLFSIPYNKSGVVSFNKK